MTDALLSPYPYFGGKSKAADEIWLRLGDVDNFVDPFFGFMAVLLARPNYTGQTECVNDLDAYLSNFWRAIQHDPQAVARYADYPTNECDLTARHLWLVNQGAESIQRCWSDPDYYDAKVAGWWVWGISIWIGSSWCAGNGPWRADPDTGLLVKAGGGTGVSKRLVHLGDAGQGINSSRAADLCAYFNRLSERLRRVRVCCGDWTRVVTNGALSHGEHVGVFLDPPYSMDKRDKGIYNHDAQDLPGQVLAWCKANGDNPRYRIALAGYEGEHNDLEDMGWSVYNWVAGASYKTAKGDQTGNRKLERLWFSPHCINGARLFR